MSPHENMLLLLIRGKYMLPFRDSAVYYVVQSLYPNYNFFLKKEKYILSLSLILTHTRAHTHMHTHTYSTGKNKSNMKLMLL